MRRYAALIVILLATSGADATVRWSPEDAEAAKAEFSALDRSREALPTARKTTDPLGDFQKAVWFVASMQVTDTLSSHFGGIREAEHLLDIVQTDNTSESIWMFSRYYQLTGDPLILPYLERSWTYVNNHPAYNEEGGSQNYGGYYRYYNCGWALRGNLKYEEVFGDTLHRPYVDSCANYLATHNLSRLGSVPFLDNVNPPVLAWGAGNLRTYGNARNDSLWKYRGWLRANRVKGWVEGDPDILNTEEWAMSHGAVIWGLLEAYFDEFPLDESLWVATYVPTYYDTLADPDPWENAHQGWIALGDHRLAQSTGDAIWETRHAAMTDYLLAFDATDLDGGIYAQPADTDTMDHAWITSYLGFMALDPLISAATNVASGGAPISRVHGLLPNRPNPFNPITTIPFEIDVSGDVLVEVWNPAGRLVQTLFRGTLPAGSHAVRWDGTDRTGSPAASGVYFYTLDQGVGVESKKMLLVR